MGDGAVLGWIRSVSSAQQVSVCCGPVAPVKPSKPIASDPRIGALVDGRYRILARLGGGGMGVVYLAEHERIAKRVALKVMHPQSASEELLARFEREAMAAASIGHPNIVAVMDMGYLEDGTPFLVQEYLDGIDLADCVAREGPFSVARALHIGRQLCDALAAVHAKQIVHRDLKPENVMLVEERGTADVVKVLDFGICKLIEAGTTGDRKSLTRTHSTLGTPQYMAPEQFRGSARVDARADIYGVGALLYYMLTGRPLYEADDVAVLFMRISTEAPPSVRLVRRDVPHELDQIIRRACSKQPQARFPTCEDMGRALSQVPSARAQEPYPTRRSFPGPALPLNCALLSAPTASDQPAAHAMRTLELPEDVLPPLSPSAPQPPEPSLVSHTAIFGPPLKKRILQGTLGALAIATLVLAGVLLHPREQTASPEQPAPLLERAASEGRKPSNALKQARNTPPQTARAPFTLLERRAAELPDAGVAEQSARLPRDEARAAARRQTPAPRAPAQTMSSPAEPAPSESPAPHVSPPDEASAPTQSPPEGARDALKAYRYPRRDLLEVFE